MNQHDARYRSDSGPPTDCPAPDELAAFLAGDVDIDRGRMEGHLLECDRCVRILGEASSAPSTEDAAPGHMIDRAAALVTDRPAVLASISGRNGWPRIALAAAAALAFAFVGYHVGRVNGAASSDGPDFISVVSFETLNGGGATSDLEFALLTHTGETP